MRDPYTITDKTITRMNRRIIKRFNKAANIAAYDELHVMKNAKTLYKNLDSDAREELLELAALLYADFTNEAEESKKNSGKADSDEEKGTKSSKKTKSGTKINEKWLIAILSEYNYITKYSYTGEIERKRGYYVESLLSAETSSDKKIARRKAMSYWSRMCAQYADIVTNKAVIQAYSDAEVKKVKRVAQKDERVCSVCASLDGRLYDIDKIPKQPHWGCRCYYIPFFSKRLTEKS